MEPTLSDALTRWRAADLIDDDHVTSITTFEEAREPATPGPAAPPPPPPTAPASVEAAPAAAVASDHGAAGVLVEGLAYVGAALAFGAAFVVFADVWDQLEAFGRVSLALIATVLIGGASAALREHQDGPLHRLSTLLAALAATGVALTVAVTLYELTDVRDGTLGMLAGLAGLAASVPLERYRPSWPVTLVMGASLLSAVFGFEDTVDLLDSSAAAGVTLMGLGLAWAALGWGQVLRPQSAFEVTGLLVGGIGVQVLAFDDFEVAAVVIGLLISGGVLALGLREERLPPSVLGGIGITVFAPQLVTTLFEDTLAAPLALFIGGISLVLVAVAILRSRRVL